MKSFSSKYDCIVDSIDCHENILMHGPGGTGKSYTIGRLVRQFAASRSIACTGMTGVAAANLREELQNTTGTNVLVDVRTLHSWAGIGNGNGTPDEVLQRTKRNAGARRRWNTVDLLFIDEVSMLGANLLEMLDYIARNVRRTFSKPFGGLQVVFSGDFLQIPPVHDDWCFSSACWETLEFMPYIFEIGYRFDDPRYFELLLRARQGCLNSDDEDLLRGRVTSFEALDLSDRDAIIPSVLFAHNSTTEAYNERALRLLNSPVRTFTATDERHGKTAKALDHVIPRRIDLAVGAQVLLKANLNINLGLVNGARGIVTSVDPVLEVKFRNGVNQIITPHTWRINENLKDLAKDDHRPRVSFSRTQIPLILAWAITIHRAQSSTLECAVIDLGDSIFTCGQAYVALSRVKTLNGLFLKAFSPRSVFADATVLNFDQQLKRREAVEYIE